MNMEMRTTRTPVDLTSLASALPSAEEREPLLTPPTPPRPIRLAPILRQPFLQRNVSVHRRLVLPPIDREELERTKERRIHLLRRKQVKLQRMIERIEELMECTKDHLDDLRAWKLDIVENIGDLQYGNRMDFVGIDESEEEARLQALPEEP